MAISWYCAETKPYEMERARDQLKAQGFEICYPVFLTRRVVRHRVKETEHPMFPGYLPVAFDVDDRSWEKINYTRGVKRLMCHVSEEYVRPIPIPRIYMTDLLARVAEGLVCDLSKLSIFNRGQQLKVLDGPFAGFSGACEFSSRKRVEVLLSIFGRATSVRLAPDQVALLN